MSQKVLTRLTERFGEAVISTDSRFGDDVAVVKRESLVDMLTFLRDEPDLKMNLPVDLTAVDFIERDARFEVIYIVYSTEHHHRVRLKVILSEDDATVPTASGVYSGFNWFEREVWDMFGIKFAGHPDLRRMFMYEEFVGHALRKDYPKEKRQPLARREGMS